MSFSLEAALADVNYRSHRVRLSSLLGIIQGWANATERPLDQYIKELQRKGNLLRSRTKSADALAILGVLKIQSLRQQIVGHSDRPAEAVAYILRSLKNPAEVESLRRIYGPYFFLVSAYSPFDSRLKSLAEDIARSRQSTKLDDYLSVAQELIHKDQAEEDNKYGQRVRDTFPLADAFFNVDRVEELGSEVERFVEIIFGHPYQTPTRDEFGMFHAKAAALRSADLSRQVGAVISTHDGNLIAVGTNEVPKPNGGLYWTGDDGDARDFQRSRNESHLMRRTTLGEVLDKLQRESYFNDQKTGGRDIDSLIDSVMPIMKDTQLMDIGEFGRTVHAEMAALLDASQRGVPVRGCTLFTTTFPCHNCTRHIIAAGIERAVYIEPFPKSHAEKLHKDAIIVDSTTFVPGRVNFQPFVGVSPSRYIEFFTAVIRKANDGSPVKFNKKLAVPRFSEKWPMPVYPTIEEREISDLRKKMKSTGLAFERKLRTPDPQQGF